MLPRTKSELSDAVQVKHCALSLVGEPIMYPQINELAGQLHDRGISTFLVTNAQFPDRIRCLPCTAVDCRLSIRTSRHCLAALQAAPPLRSHPIAAIVLLPASERLSTAVILHQRLHNECSMSFCMSTA